MTGGFKNKQTNVIFISSLWSCYSDSERNSMFVICLPSRLMMEGHWDFSFSFLMNWLSLCLNMHWRHVTCEHKINLCYFFDVFNHIKIIHIILLINFFRHKIIVLFCFCLFVPRQTICLHLKDSLNFSKLLVSFSFTKKPPSFLTKLVILQTM